ncbi:MAG: hypothetical protein U1D55_18075 [Phycisphaerae bacterium]
MKIMLDECVTQGPARILVDFFSITHPPVSAVFLPEYMRGTGIKDEQWAEQIASDGDWRVITADWDKCKTGAKRAIDGPPLHKILPTLKITALFWSSSIQRATGDVKVSAITAVWPKLRRLFQHEPAGTIIKLHQGSKGGFELRKRDGSRY